MESPILSAGIYGMVMLAYGAVGCAIACSVLAVVGRDALARSLARTSMTLAGLMFLVVPVLVVLLVSGVANTDASSKATALARGISGTMNCAAMALPAGVIGAVVWWRTNRRLKKLAG